MNAASFRGVMRPMRIAACLILLLCLPTLAEERRDGGTAKSPKKKPVATCPATRAEIKNGGVCRVASDEVCHFEGDGWCACELSRCVTAAGPIPNCEPTPLWECRNDGCPRTPSGACSAEGKSCAYDDGLCLVVSSCRKGTWHHSEPNCRPAAPPNLIKPPQPG